jgi:hypothetical protein
MACGRVGQVGKRLARDRAHCLSAGVGSIDDHGTLEADKKSHQRQAAGGSALDRDVTESMPVEA